MTDEPGFEDRRRQDQRDRRIWWTLVAVGLVFTAAIMMLVRPLILGRLEAAQQLDRATALIDGVGKATIRLDVVVRSVDSTLSPSQSLDTTKTIEAAEKTLAEATALLDDAYPHLTEDEQARSTRLKAVATARQGLMESAKPVLLIKARATEANGLADDGWKRAAAGDAAVNRSAAQYNKLTMGSVRGSTGLSAEAKRDFVAARDLLSQASTVFPEGGLGAYVAYVDQRLRQVDIGQQSETAWLAGRAAQADSLVASYNAADAKGAQMAGQLRASPNAAIAAAYGRVVGSALKEYLDARGKVEEAEKALRAL